ncbi:hypothetical protein GE21DRAFT_7274 [Neurospora crassa]|uniref:magnesium chelatase n=2 Tax=Neurospora crassa TaxID=5141 RepID=Q1K7Y8_NEUCR|nr:hypothetical protein NCU03712 [Neurospora crassa OR74A]EAA32252.1 hypothetical protein NCU03712 [Neurospora crassa OR74A]KHE88930.1 hypothetical protein GE21DRAFT_7274 [Neurospora crassa]CAC28855.1 conserved hypothetical protein [Neurospora crassa]|eukprot:XP_961488.1 hypothetical protein NCU03712 [Neurospora crassa OR74A]
MEDDIKERQQAELQDKIHSLSDLELAVLLSLIAREHCLISTEPDFVEDLSKELCLTAVKTFGLTPVIVPCHSQMTLDDFAAALLVPVTPPSSPLPNNSNNPQHHHSHRSVPSGSGSYFSSKQNVPGSSSSAHPPPPSQQQQQQQPPATQIANVVLAQNLDHAPRAVQIQALELLRARRLFTRTSVQTAPKQFLFVAVVGAESGGQARVTHHLNDFLYLAHWHDPEDGFAYLEEQAEEGWAGAGGFGGHLGKLGVANNNNDNDDEAGDDSPYAKTDDDQVSTDSGSSVVKRGVGSMANSGLINESYHSALSGPGLGPGRLGGAGVSLSPQLTFHSNDPTAVGPTEGLEPPLLSDSEIAHLAQLSLNVCVDIDVRRYQMNIVAFLRMHRAVSGGITPQATKHFEQLMRSLAPLHGLDFVTPALVGLAAKKVYLHRIEIVASPERERSMQWGSEPVAVEAMLEGVGPEEVIEDVLGMVAVPQ